MSKHKFNPLIFLASLGAGGIAVIPFAFLQYTQQVGNGLISRFQVAHGSLPWKHELLFSSLEGIMVVFTVLHLVLTVIFLRGLFRWMGTPEYKTYESDPLGNAGLLTPLLSLAMTMNVVIGAVRYFIPWLAINLQTVMPAALVAWLILWFATMYLEFKLLKRTFNSDFETSKIGFGWLLHPFTIGMVTVTGAGIAAMATSAPIAHTAAFFTLVSGMMGLFLLTVKLNSIFLNQFKAASLPGKEAMPSMLIIIPNITLYALSAFRLGHYFEHQMGLEMHTFMVTVIALAFAFETWYMGFGLYLLRDYLLKDFRRKEFYVTKWGLICPFVAYAVLGSFFYKVYAPYPVVFWAILVTTFVAISFYAVILSKNIACVLASRANINHNCAKGLKPSRQVS